MKTRHLQDKHITGYTPRDDDQGYKGSIFYSEVSSVFQLRMRAREDHDVVLANHPGVDIWAAAKGCRLASLVTRSEASHLMALY